MIDSVVQMTVLGSVRVLKEHRPVAIGGPKPQLLMARLALEAPKPVSTDELIGVMWGDRLPATARKMLQKYVWQLRHVIGDDLLVTEGDGYALALDPSQVDALRFEQLLEEAIRARDRGDTERAWELLAEALALWRGRPMAGLDDVSFVSDAVRRLEEMHLVAFEEQIQVGLALGKHDLLLPRIQELASQHPFRERLWGALMLALYRSGRHTEALASLWPPPQQPERRARR
jgi:DNA-binding SARP family transcriptional activator